MKANPVVEGLPVEKDKLGRVIVDEDLGLPPFPGVFAIGDCASFWDPRLQAPLPPTAQVAVQQARWVARNIAKSLQGRGQEPFVYRHYGDLVSLGTGDGVEEQDPGRPGLDHRLPLRKGPLKAGMVTGR